MKSNVQVQPGFMPPGDDLKALIDEVAGELKNVLKNEREAGNLRKSDTVATSDPQSINTSGDKGAPNVKTSEAQTLKAERSAAETSSSGGGALPVKKNSPSASESSSSASPMFKGSPSAEESSKSASASGSPSAGAIPGEGSASASGDPATMPPVEGGEGAPAEGVPGEGAPPADPSAQGAQGPSFEELVQMYAQLPPEDLQAHMAAIEQAVQSSGGGAAAPGAGPGMPPGAPPSAPPSAGPGMPPSAPPSAGPGMPPMGKSEKEMMARMEKTEANLSALAEAMTNILTMPKRKAMNGLNIIPMQKSEQDAPAARPSFDELKKNPKALHEELKKMTLPESGLKKAERDLVNDFYCRRISVDGLASVFQEKANK